MKVLMLCATEGRIGGWYRYVPLGQALFRRGASVTLVCTSPTNVFRFETYVDRGLKIIEVPRFKGGRFFERSTRLPWDILFRMGLVGVGRFDVVHGFCHTLNSAFPLWATGILSPRTVKIYDREDLWRDGGLRGPRRPAWTASGINDRLDNWFEAHTGWLADSITTVSQDLRERTIAHGYDPTRIFDLPNGCRIDEFSPGDVKAARNALRLPQDRPILLYVAVGTYDVKMVMDVMTKLPALGQPNCLAVMLGVMTQEIRAEVARRGLGNAFDIRGWVSQEDLKLHLQAANIGLMPQADTPFNRSRWPIKVGDYLAAGLPVATSLVGEVGRLIARSGAGVATAPDSDALAVGIAEVLAQDSGSLRHLARRTAEGLSWDVVAVQAEDIYRATIARRNEPS